YGWEGTRRAWKRSFLPARAKEDTLRRAGGDEELPGEEPSPRCSRPKHRTPNPRQAGLLADGSERNVLPLTAPNGLPTAAQRSHSGVDVFGSLADHSGGPATDSHRLPFSPRAGLGARGTCRDCWGV